MTREEEIKAIRRELEQDPAFRELCAELVKNPELKHFVIRNMNK